MSEVKSQMSVNQRYLPSAKQPKESAQKLDIKQKTSKTVFNKWWIMGVGIVVNHIIGAYAFFWHPSPSLGFYLALAIASFLQLLGITAGYHRLWSHGAYRASLVVRVALSVFATASWQGSIKWWVVRHRMHHRFTDTALDPYDSTKGLYFSHCGWLFEKPTYQQHFSLIDVSDLKRDKVVRWNTMMYPSGVIFFGFVFPVVVGYAMGDAIQGFLWIGVMSRIVSWTGIFLVNSLAHWDGVKWYNSGISATGSLLCAVLSNGEGNHNFHHEFPKDYRHGVRWCDWDPTKWTIWVLSKCGLAYDLHTTDAHLVRQSVLQQDKIYAAERVQALTQEYALHMASAPSGQGTPALQTLPCCDMPTFRLNASKSVGPLFIIDGYVIDASSFTTRHPGGAKLLHRYHGKDATKPFHGGRNIHTPAAINLMARYRVAVMKEADLPVHG